LKDQEYDSDEDLRKEMMTYDERLAFVNTVDFEVHGDPTAAHLVGSAGQDSVSTKEQSLEQAKAMSEDSNQLPIILHEREIIENIENFVVTIVCGETGSGKSTQIP